jgi:hypothetical protein
MHLALLLAVVAFTLYVANASLFVALHVRATGYSPVRHAMSDYGVGPSRRLFSIYAGVGSAGAVALAAALWVAPRPPTPPWLLAVLLAMVAGRIGLALFPTDLEGRKLTLVGLLHYACAVASFAAAYVFIRNATPRVTGELWEPARPVLAALAWFALPALVANCVTMAPPLRRVFGLFERVFLATVLLWFGAASGALALTLR